MTHIDLPALIAAYGYPATFVGALFEGETVLTLAGLAVHRGHLSFPLLWIIAASAATLGDVFYFAIGRRYGAAVLSRWPTFKPAIDRVHRLIDRMPALSVIAVRFLYGMRIAGPVVIGSGTLSWPRYVALNVAGSLLWSACWLGAGYALGAAAEQALGNLAKIERELFVGVLVVGAIVVVAVRLRARRNAQALLTGSSPK